MSLRKAKLGTLGLAFGACALLLAVVHFWAGPFSPQPSLEDVVAERAVAIRDATLARLQGREAPVREAASSWNADRIATLATALLGALALVLAVLGFVRREPARACGGAAVLGASAIAFQFAVIALGAILLVVLIAVVLNGIGFG